MQNKPRKSWKIDTIETDKSAEKFAELLEQEPGKTYFLQGKWGSGKTKYLKTVESLTEDKLRFVYLKLWKPKSNESLEKQLFSAVFPDGDFFLTRLSWGAVSIMIIGSVFLALRSLFPVSSQHNAWLTAVIIATIVTTLFNLMENKVINVDKILLYCSLHELQCKRCPAIVLVVDDFDRIDPKMQEELYKVFNAIQENGGNARIIFVGDYENIEQVKDNYLNKIIDQVISLPFILDVQNFASKLETTISKNLEENLSDSTIKNLFISEHRTLRDANQFLAYVEDEFFRQEKKGKVQTDQQLYIIYLYLFHKKLYRKLREGWLPQKDESVKALKPVTNEKKSESDDIQGDNEDKINEYTKLILATDEKDNIYPKNYRKNKSLYFINEYSKNHAVFDLIKFLKNNSEKLYQIAFSEKNDSDTYYPELVDFLKSQSSDSYTEEIMPQLGKAVLFAMNSELRHEPNELIKTILEKIKDRSLMEFPWKKGLNEITVKSESEQINKIDRDIRRALQVDNNVSLTKLIYIYRTCFPIFGTIHDTGQGHIGKSIGPVNRFILTIKFSEQAEKIESEKAFGQQVYDAEALLVQLCFSPDTESDMLQQMFNVKQLTVDSKVDKIEQLCDSEYMAFWNAYLGNVTWQKVSTVLDFSYNGQNYADFMYDRYQKIQQTIFSYFDSRDSPKLGKFLRSKEWVCFILRVANKIGINNFVFQDYKQEDEKSQVRSAINILLEAYASDKRKTEKHKLDVMEDINEKFEIEVMQDLLRKVETDPNWTKKLDIPK